MTLAAPFIRHRLGAMVTFVVILIALLIPLSSYKAERRRRFLGVCIGTVLVAKVVLQTAIQLSKTP